MVTLIGFLNEEVKAFLIEIATLARLLSPKAKGVAEER
jgi:hypothetical protein